MKTTLIAGALAVSILASFAGRVLAETSDYINPNATSDYYDQMDREGRGGQGSG